MRQFFKFAWLVPLGLMVLPLPIHAQVDLGDFKLSSNGTIASGYTADYGNQVSSDHGWTIGGVANLTGSFYSPDFLSFNIGAYLNQSTANSQFQSITNSSGVNASASIFGGSHFPGSINYSRAINSQGNYDIPGLANYVSHGNNDTLGVAWIENFPRYPTVSAAFQKGDGDYTVYGTDNEGKNTFANLNIHSNYSIEGFNLGGFYTRGNGHSLIPQFVSGESDTETRSTTDGYGANFSHKLPLNGSVTGYANRSGWDTSYLGTGTSGNIDYFNTTANVQPTEKFSLSGSATYSDNLSGQLIEAVVNAGGTASGLNSSQTSNSLDLSAAASYAPAQNMHASATVERRTQNYLGENYGVTSYGAGGFYTHKVPDGNFNVSLNMSDNTEDKNGNNYLEFSANTNYAGVLKGWTVNGSFGYSQDVQTLLITYLNSTYDFSGGISRRWGRFYAGAGASAGRTALTQEPDTANSSESYYGTVGYRPWITATGSYNKSDGQALLTGAGLTTVPVPPPVLPSNLISLYGGDGYSIGISSNPVQGLSISSSYATSHSNTLASGVTSFNNNTQFNSLIMYRVRKLDFESGYARLEQGFSGSGTSPAVISSFYIGLSRWFNFF